MNIRSDESFMREALQLAALGEGLTRPNPPVGAVVVKAGRIVGRGHHRKAGRAHAEVEALAEAGARARGATLYVTLEPCSTHGRTPPCTDLIVRSGVARVVCASIDPNPAHAGRGLVLLRAAGVKAASGVCQPEGDALIAPFALRMLRGTPQVILKLAATLDGRIADREGRSRWITGSESRARVHELRRRSDAILVGAQTVRLDNPSLLPRPRLGRQPYRVVCTSRGELPLDSAVLTDRFAAQTLVACARPPAPARRRSLEAGGARVLEVSSRRGRLDLGALLAQLAELGVMRVLCEGGGAMAAALVRGQLVDEIHWFMAPTLLGGDARPALDGPGWLMEQKPAWRFESVETLGSDVFLRCVPEGASGPFPIPSTKE